MDISILDFMQTYFRNDLFDAVMPWITRLGDYGILWIFCALVLLVIPKTRRVGGILAVSLALEALLCNVILKPLVARTRPYEVNTMIELLIARPLDYSFPSGHTAAAFASALALYFGRNRLWIPALILAVLLAFSRMYLYVHYPSDVLAGALIGIAAGWAGSVLLRNFENGKMKK